MTDKVKSSFYMPPERSWQMKVEAKKMGMGYPSEFITYLFEKFYQEVYNKSIYDINMEWREFFKKIDKEIKKI